MHSTGENPLFRDSANGLADSPCRLPRWAEDQPTAQAFFQAALGCLNQKWSGTLNRAGLPFREPQLFVPPNSNGLKSPCTTTNPGLGTPFYCSMNEAIYMPMDRVLRNRRGANYGVFLATLAHEYGHHVQALSGISDAAWQQRKAAGVRTAQGLETSRRQELQASCFGGMFLGNAQANGAWPVTVSNAAIRDNYKRGDEYSDMRDHGTSANNGSWMEHGYKTNRNFQCNTWKASAKSVS